MLAIADTGFTPTGKVLAVVKDDAEGLLADAGFSTVDDGIRRRVELVQVDTFQLIENAADLVAAFLL